MNAIKEDIARLEGIIESSAANTKAEIIRWMFSGFAILMLAIIGLYFKH